MKYSQAFAAFRASLITDKNYAIQNELVPVFNSRCEDIRRITDNDFEKYHNQAKSDNLKRTLTYDLIMHRKQVIEKVQEDVAAAIDARLINDKAEIKTEEVEKDGKVKTITTALFPDGSSARVPQNLWVDYGMFDRV